MHKSKDGVARDEETGFNVSMNNRGSGMNRLRLAGLMLGVMWGLGWRAWAFGLVSLGPLQQGSLIEFQVTGLPAFANPFDPDEVAIDATFTLADTPALTVPAFWYQGYQRSLVDGVETLAVTGAPEWRLRFTPMTAGNCTVSVAVRTNGVLMANPLVTNLTISSAADNGKPSGFVRVAGNNRYFETSRGNPLPLVGECVCWPGRRGTYDYDDWFGAMNLAGENYARLWMAPWAFGIEAEPGTLVHYRLDRAWQLDYVFQLGEAKGIYLMPCLDYHGMFETQPDYWGGNNLWPENPYNAANGGPCANQDAFFTDANARHIYQKRLRYLVARYGSRQNLLAWQFFNELDNVYQYLSPSHVANWHAAMGDWLRGNDPYRHLVTTSMTGGSDRPEIWSLAQMDFADYHSYGLPHPVNGLSDIVNSFCRRYQKPVLIDEYGIDWRGWSRASDPYLRGFRQGLWTGALSGSVGTAMAWYWENIHSENVYPLYRALRDFVSRTTWGQGPWSNLGFQTPGPAPATVGSVLAGGQPFSATLELNSGWGPKLRGQLGLATSFSATHAPDFLDAYVQGSGHPDLRIPLRVETWLGTNASLTAHVNSVSSGAILSVMVDGKEVFRQSLPNLDGSWNLNNEYNTNFSAALPAGKHLVEVRNAGGDWFYLDWIRFDNVLPSQYADGWSPAPAAVGVQGEKEGLLYVASPFAHYPAGATNPTPDLFEGGTITITNLAAGNYQARWFDPATAAAGGTTQGRSDGTNLVLPLPGFREDLAGRLIGERSLVLDPPEYSSNHRVRLGLTAAPNIDCLIEGSTNLLRWEELVELTNSTGSASWIDFQAPDFSRRFYRARLDPY